MWSGSECALSILRKFLVFSGFQTSLGISVVLFIRDEFRFTFAHYMLSFAREATEIPGHLGQSLGSEEHQEEEPYEQHLLEADTKHEA